MTWLSGEVFKGKVREEGCGVCDCCGHAFWETNSLRTMQIVGVQFITLVGPRQSLLLAKASDQHL